MISAGDFPNAGKLAAGAAAIAPRIAALKRRCEVAGVPAVYVNDNHGYWRSDFRQLVLQSMEKEVIVTGVATDQCIVMSATDARMRDYDVRVPEDCVAAQTAERNRRGLDYLREAQR